MVGSGQVGQGERLSTRLLMLADEAGVMAVGSGHVEYALGMLGWQCWHYDASGALVHVGFFRERARMEAWIVGLSSTSE
nr:hypothetical protein [Dietzia maris]